MAQLAALQKKLNDPMFRQFSVNGALGLSDTRYFRVDISPWIIRIFLPKILSAYCVTLVSPRANGKTSTIFQTAHFLQRSNIVPVIVDLQKAFDLRTSVSFWTSLSERLKHVFDNPLTSNSSLGFEQFFSVIAGKKVEEIESAIDYLEKLKRMIQVPRGHR